MRLVTRRLWVFVGFAILMAGSLSGAAVQAQPTDQGDVNDVPVIEAVGDAPPSAPAQQDTGMIQAWTVDFYNWDGDALYGDTIGVELELYTEGMETGFYVQHVVRCWQGGWYEDITNWKSDYTHPTENASLTNYTIMWENFMGNANLSMTVDVFDATHNNTGNADIFIGYVSDHHDELSASMTWQSVWYYDEDYDGMNDSLGIEFVLDSNITDAAFQIEFYVRYWNASMGQYNDVSFDCWTVFTNSTGHADVWIDWENNLWTDSFEFEVRVSSPICDESKFDYCSWSIGSWLDFCNTHVQSLYSYWVDWSGCNVIYDDFSPAGLRYDGDLFVNGSGNAVIHMEVIRDWDNSSWKFDSEQYVSWGYNYFNLEFYNYHTACNYTAVMWIDLYNDDWSYEGRLWLPASTFYLEVHSGEPSNFEWWANHWTFDADNRGGDDSFEIETEFRGSAIPGQGMEVELRLEIQRWHSEGTGWWETVTNDNWRYWLDNSSTNWERFEWGFTNYDFSTDHHVQLTICRTDNWEELAFYDFTVWLETFQWSGVWIDHGCSWADGMNGLKGGFDIDSDHNAQVLSELQIWGDVWVGNTSSRVQITNFDWEFMVDGNDDNNGYINWDSPVEEGQYEVRLLIWEYNGYNWSFAGEYSWFRDVYYPDAWIRDAWTNMEGSGEMRFHADVDSRYPLEVRLDLVVDQYESWSSASTPDQYISNQWNLWVTGEDNSQSGDTSVIDTLYGIDDGRYGISVDIHVYRVDNGSGYWEYMQGWFWEFSTNQEAPNVWFDRFNLHSNEPGLLDVELDLDSDGYVNVRMEVWIEGPGIDRYDDLYVSVDGLDDHDSSRCDLGEVGLEGGNYKVRVQLSVQLPDGSWENRVYEERERWVEPFDGNSNDSGDDSGQQPLLPFDFVGFTMMLTVISVFALVARRRRP